MSICPDNQFLKDEKTIVVRIVDEGAGEFVEIESLDGVGKVQIDPDQWEVLRDAINSLMDNCKDEV